jgi:hypothetical protein
MTTANRLEPFFAQKSKKDAAYKRRRRIGKSWRRVYDPTESRVLKRQTGFWRGVASDVMARVEKIGQTGFAVDDVFRPSDYKAAFNRLMVPEWNRMVYRGVEFEQQWFDLTDIDQRFLAHVLQDVSLEDAAPPPSIQVEMSPELQRKVKKFLADREVGVWGDVGETSKKSLKRAIEKGLKEGDKIDDMAKRIRGVLNNQTKYTSRRIARTEVTGSMNYGQQVTRTEIGIDNKWWISTIDKLTRGMKPGDRFNHVAADGQIVKNNEAYTVSGEKLIHPGDSSLGASAGNIIHCRCTSVAYFD